MNDQDHLLDDLFPDPAAETFSADDLVQLARHVHKRRQRRRLAAGAVLAVGLLTAVLLTDWNKPVLENPSTAQTPAAETDAGVESLDDDQLLELLSANGHQSAMLIDHDGYQQLIIFENPVERQF